MKSSIKFINKDNSSTFADTSLGMIASENIEKEQPKIAKHFKAGGTVEATTEMGKITLTTINELQHLCDNFILQNAGNINLVQSIPTATMSDIYTSISTTYTTELPEIIKEAAHTLSKIMNQNLGKCTDQAWISTVEQEKLNTSLNTINQYIASLEYIEGLIHACAASGEGFTITDDDLLKVSQLALKRTTRLF